MFCLITGNVFAVSNDFFRIYFQFLLKPFVVFRRFQRVIFNPGHPWIKFPRTPSSRRPLFHRTRHSLIAVREKHEKTRREGRLDAEMRIRSAPEDWRVARRKLVAQQRVTGVSSCARLAAFSR